MKWSVFTLTCKLIVAILASKPFPSHQIISIFIVVLVSKDHREYSV